MTTLKTLTIVAALLAGGTSLALAQNGPATGGLPPVAGGPGGYPGYGYAASGYGYAATAPLYDYAAPGYGYGAVAPATGRSTIVTPGSAYAAPPVMSGYATQPIYDYAPGYGYGYTPGYWNRGYWGRACWLVTLKTRPSVSLAPKS
jgi:hypothetical protein